MNPIHLAIDASAIRAGGGVTHLVEVLGALEPGEHGIARVEVHGGRGLLAALPERPWLEKQGHPWLDAGLARRALWQRRVLDRALPGRCHVLFVPGGSYAGRFSPMVSMAQSLLPFDRGERARFGWSRTRLRLEALERVQTATFARSERLILLSEATRRAVELRLGPLGSRASIVPHGVAERFFHAPRPARAVAELSTARPFRVLYPSIINVYKHQWHVVEAVAALRAEGLPVALDLVGPAYPPALARLREALSRWDPEGAGVRYLGPSRYDDLATHYRDADALAFASSCETFGMIVLEAMAAGLPIACSDRSSLPEVLSDTGVYFDPEAPSSIADALRRLILDPDLRARLAHAAHARAQSFTWARCARETFGIIAEAARGDKPRGDLIRGDKPRPGPRG